MILVNGDSITFGQGLLPNELPWPTLLLKNNINIAEAGSSNDSIYRRSVECIVLTEKIKLLIIGWSALYRLELGDNYSKPKTILPTYSNELLPKELATNWLGEYWYFKKFLLNLYNLKLLTIQYSIDFYCINFGYDTAKMFSKIKSYKVFKTLFELSVWNDNEIRKEFLLINKLSNFCEDIWLVNPAFDVKSVYLNKNQAISSDDWHPTQQGHKSIADFIKTSEIFNTIKTNK